MLPASSEAWKMKRPDLGPTLTQWVCGRASWDPGLTSTEATKYLQGLDIENVCLCRGDKEVSGMPLLRKVGKTLCSHLYSGVYFSSHSQWGCFVQISTLSSPQPQPADTPHICRRQKCHQEKPLEFHLPRQPLSAPSIICLLRRTPRPRWGLPQPVPTFTVAWVPYELVAGVATGNWAFRLGKEEVVERCSPLSTTHLDSESAALESYGLFLFLRKLR